MNALSAIVSVSYHSSPEWDEHQAHAAAAIPRYAVCVYTPTPCKRRRSLPFEFKAGTIVTWRVLTSVVTFVTVCRTVTRTRPIKTNTRASVQRTCCNPLTPERVLCVESHAARARFEHLTLTSGLASCSMPCTRVARAG